MIPPKENSLLGRYRIVRKIGGNICVGEYIAEHLFLTRQFKMTVLVHEDLYQPQALEAIKTHLREFSRLRHSALPQIYAAEQVNTYFFFTGDAVAGKPLRTRIARSKARSVKEFAEFFLRLGDIVLYLQSKNISSQNLDYADIVESNDRWYVANINFLSGVSKILDTEDEHLREFLASESGVFFEKGFIDTRANVRRIGELMYQAVAWGNLDEALESRRKEEEELSKKRKRAETVRLLSDLDPRIEELIVRTRQEKDAGGYVSLEEVFSAISGLEKESKEKEVPEASTAMEETSADVFPPEVELSQPRALRRQKLNLFLKKRLGYIAIAGIVAVIVFLIIFYAPFWVPRNKIPTARAVASPRLTYVGGEVELDASASFDADEDRLSYYWELVEPPGGNVIFSANQSRDAKKVKAKLNQKGKHKIRLRVHDGVAFSQPTHITVIVY